MIDSRKNHWKTVYANKQPHQVSWTQDIPHISLEFIELFGLPKNAKIIDVGGGDGTLVDCLLERGYEDITVLDISVNALERAKKRLGERSKKVSWIVSDILDFEPTTAFDIWHDRATFHFLTTSEQVQQYIKIVEKSVTGFISISTFSEQGPLKCSGLEIKQYAEKTLEISFSEKFQKIKCIQENHITPFNTQQNFVFCGFKRK